jgi:hypothetical protein
MIEASSSWPLIRVLALSNTQWQMQTRNIGIGNTIFESALSSLHLHLIYLGPNNSTLTLNHVSYLMSSCTALLLFNVNIPQGTMMWEVNNYINKQINEVSHLYSKSQDRMGCKTGSKSLTTTSKLGLRPTQPCIQWRKGTHFYSVKIM